MSDDIVNELRGSIHRACNGRTPAETPCRECQERQRAIDEIKRLRAALAVKDNHDHFDCAAAMAKKDIEIERMRNGIRHYLTSDDFVTSNELWTLIEEDDDE